MKESLITAETAKLAREKGFNERQEYFYCNTEDLYFEDGHNGLDRFIKGEKKSA